MSLPTLSSPTLLITFTQFYGQFLCHWLIDCLIDEQLRVYLSRIRLRALLSYRHRQEYTLTHTNTHINKSYEKNSAECSGSVCVRVYARAHVRICDKNKKSKVGLVNIPPTYIISSYRFHILVSIRKHSMFEQLQKQKHHTHKYTYTFSSRHLSPSGPNLIDLYEKVCVCFYMK